MKIKRADEKPMVIHTKAKTRIHSHEPKQAAIKGRNIYSKCGSIDDNSVKGREDRKTVLRLHFRKSTVHQQKQEKRSLINRMKQSAYDANASIKVKKQNLHIAGAIGTEGAKALSDQLEGGQEVQQATAVVYDLSRPVNGTASRGAALFRRQAIEKKIKKVGVGQRIARRKVRSSAKNSMKQTATEAAKQLSRETAENTVKETAKKTANKAAKAIAQATATSASITAGGSAGPAGMAAGNAAGKAASKKIEHDDRVRSNRIRKIRFFLDKTKSEDQQQDSIAKLAKDIVTRRISEWVRVHAGSIGIALLLCALAVMVTVGPVVATVGVLYNSPFAIFLPPLEDGDTVVPVASGYFSDFQNEVNTLASDHEGYDEGEVVYIDYEGTEAVPSNIYDIIAVYMVKYGIGDTAVVMNDTSRSWLQSVVDDMCSYTTSSDIKDLDDGEGGTAAASVLYVNVSLKNWRDMISVYGFETDEVSMLQEIMSPENLATLGYTGDGDAGNPGVCSLTEEEINAILAGITDASQRTACSYALHRVGYPYSQDLRDTGNYYDCSSLAYYSWRSAGADISHGGSTTAASEGQGLDEAGKTVSFADMQPGDLIFYSYTRNGRYKNISHVAIYVGNGKLVEAQNERNGVVYRDAKNSGSIVLIGRP